MEIFRLMGSIFIDSDEANKSIAKTEKRTDSLASRMGKGIKTAGKWALGIGVAAAGIATAAFAMTKKVTGAFDDIAKSATKLGVSTDAYQEMDYWASQNGISHENMEKAVGRLNQRIGAAADGNEKYSGALTKLGVDMDAVREGTISTEEVMYQSIQSLSEMTNEQEKAALASELFGTKLGRELMPALQDGSLSLEDAKKKAQELGIVIEEDTLNAAEEFNDTWDDLTRMMGAFGQKIIAELMPIFQSLMNWVIEHMPQIQEVFQTVFGFIGEAISIVGGFIKEQVIDRLVQLYEWIEPHLPEIQEIFVGVFEAIKEVIDGFIEAIKSATEWVKDHWSIVEPILIGIAAGIVTFKAITTAIAAYGAITKAITAIQLLFNGALAANPIGIVVVAIGALVAAGVALWKNWDTVTAKLRTLWSNISGVFGKIGSYISNIWDSVSSSTSKVWDGIVTTIKGAMNGVIGAINGMINGLNKIKIKLPKIPNWVPGLGGKGGGDLGFNIPNIPSLDVGTNYVASDGLAMIHAGEAVVPKKFNPSANPLLNQTNEKLVKLLEMNNNLLKTIANGIKAGHSIQIDGREVAKATAGPTDEEQGKRIGLNGRRVAY